MSVTRTYTLEEYIRPIWEGDTVAHETVLFREDERKARLTFPADEILGVLSSDLLTEFEEGRDWLLEDGCIVRPEGSRLPFMPMTRFYPPEHRDGQDFACSEEGHPWLGFGEGNTMLPFMTDITYRHSEPWKGPIPPSRTAKIARFLSRLEQGLESTVVFYGDSITTGANSSGVVGVPPFAAPFPEMTADALARKYGCALRLDVKPYEPLKEISPVGGRVLHYVNTSVGGMESNWARANAAERVTAYRPDLVVLAFGMNDGGKPADEFLRLTKETVALIREGTPGADILLLSTMLPHWRAAGFFGNQDKFEDALADFAEHKEHIGLAPMTSVHRYLLTRKEFYHASGNNINHPSDFLARVYAMVLLAAMGVLKA